MSLRSMAVGHSGEETVHAVDVELSPCEKLLVGCRYARRRDGGRGGLRLWEGWSDNDQSLFSSDQDLGMFYAML